MIVESKEKLPDISSELESELSATHLSEDTDKLIKDQKMKYLIADTAAFIKNVPMHEYAHNIISIRDVIDEIRDKETRQRLLACPIEIEYRDPDVNSIKRGRSLLIWFAEYACVMIQHCPKCKYNCAHLY